MKSNDNNNTGSIIFYKQLTPEEKILVDFLMNKTYNNKWLNYARKELYIRQAKNSGSCLEAKDFVSDVKTEIYSNAVITMEAETGPLFTITSNGKTTSGNLESLNSYIFTRIFYNITNYIRSNEKTVPLSEAKSLFVEIKDSFDRKGQYLTKEFFEVCITTLEEINPRYKEVLEYRYNNFPNRAIAEKLNITTRDVENTLKAIRRRLQPIAHLACL